MQDYTDIQTWRNKPDKFYDFLTRKSKLVRETSMVSPLKIDSIRLYCLLKHFISSTPNGSYTFMQKGLPLDNLFYWDFVLECDKGFIQIWRTPQFMEALYLVDISDFNLKNFLKQNLVKYHVEIDETLNGLDNHSTYINHYKSYRSCVEYLWKEVSKIDFGNPVSPETHILDDDSIYQKLKSEIRQFGEASIKFHSLGKSLILDSAFMVESFINLFIRVGATKDLKKYDDVLKKHLNSSFPDKLKNLKFYSQLMTADVDLERREVKNVNELMTIRNKYVHYDENSIHNKLDTIYFDKDFPVFPNYDEMPAIEAMKMTYHNPTFEKVKTAYESGKNFIGYIESLIRPEIREMILFFMNQNPIGFNEKRKIYTVVYSEPVAMFYGIKNKDNTTSESNAS